MSLFVEKFVKPLYASRKSKNDAFFIHNRMFSYNDFFNMVEQLYEEVKQIEEDVVGLYCPDDILTYASIVALWLSDKSYVPLNPNQPKDRHQKIITGVGTHIILSSDASYDIGIPSVKSTFTKKCITADYKQKNTINFDYIKDESLAYVLFTSGSTGTPKGVQVTKGNLAAFIDSMNNIGLDITSEDRCLQPFDLTFDFSVSSYVIPLVKRACIYTIPNKATKFTYIAELLEEHHLTVLQMVPSMIRNLLPYMEEVDVSSVRYNILCGEALTGKVIKPWHEANPNMVSYNMYGPTEDTVFCTYYLVNKGNINCLLAANDIVSIGKTFKNNEVLLMDYNNKEITEANIEGELCLCGEQLTPGYWKNDKENAEKFFEKDGERYYRSGDICYYAKDGNLMYVSRKDFQVKINGFRVELGEIENRYAAVSGGRYSVVLPYTNEQGNTELAIVIEGKEYDYKEHQTALANALPAYEVPARWLFIRSIPLNQNGKVDRKAIRKEFNL